MSSDDTVVPFPVRPRPPNAGNAVDRHIGRRILFRREWLGMSEDVLAQRLGVTVLVLQRWESGVDRMRMPTVWRIAEALDVSIVYFFAEDGVG